MHAKESQSNWVSLQECTCEEREGKTFRILCQLLPPSCYGKEPAQGNESTPKNKKKLIP